MAVQMLLELSELQAKLRAMCALARGMAHQAVGALEGPSSTVLVDVRVDEAKVDVIDVEIEDACLKLLALHQPIACDLRRVATALKIASELERVADLGVNLAERADALARLPPLDVPYQINLMAHKSLDMIDRSIESFLHENVPEAQAVRAADDEVDALNVQVVNELAQVMRADSTRVEAALHLFSAARIIERIADHATNIAEDVIYLVEGAIVRHGSPWPQSLRETA